MGFPSESDMANRDNRGPSMAVPRMRSSVVDGLLNYEHAYQTGSPSLDVGLICVIFALG